MRKIEKPTDSADMNNAGGRRTEEGAMRLMEALSAVDESLLERCEGSADVSEGKESQRQVISFARKISDIRIFNVPVWKIGSAFAAVLCVLVVGVAMQSGVSVNDSSMEADVQYTSKYESMTAENSTAGVSAASEIGTTAEGVEAATTDSMNGSGMNGADTTREETKEVVEEDRNITDKGDLQVVENSITNNLWDWLTGLSAGDAESVAEAKVEAVEKMPAMERKTEAEIYEMDKAGAYVPTVLPEGYTFDAAYVSGEGECLTVYWTRGMDSIMLRIEQVEAIPTTINLKEPETYDEYLYEIPHAETVPEEYWEVFSDPVCTSEDFCREFVEKRMISRGDQGDTDTPRGNFSVLYPDGFVVKFNGRGTAEEIWEMFCSMKGYSEN